jgi:ribonuclease HI
MTRIQNQHKYVFSFHGTLNGNSGSGAIILNPEGKVIKKYAWNIGTTTNNQGDSLTLYKGIFLLKWPTSEDVVVLGESQVIVAQMLEISNTISV